VLFSHSPQVFLFKSLIQTAHFCPYCIASHHRCKIILCFGDVWIIWGRASKLRHYRFPHRR